MNIQTRNSCLNCLELKVLKFDFEKGAVEVPVSDMKTIAQLSKLEELVVNNRKGFCDEIVKLIGRECQNLMRLSCACCMSVSDVGLLSLANYWKLSDIDFSYCSVTDHGLCAVLNPNTRRVILRGCSGISDNCIALMAGVCHSLEMLDISGCSSITSGCLAQLKLLLIPPPHQSAHHTFSLIARGSSIDDKALEEFASVTGASVNDIDLSSSTTYNPPVTDDGLDYFNFMSESEDEEVEDEWDFTDAAPGQASKPVPQLEPFDPSPPHLGVQGYPTIDDDDLLDEFLVADDPAWQSDEFSL